MLSHIKTWNTFFMSRSTKIFNNILMDIWKEGIDETAFENTATLAPSFSVDHLKVLL